MLAPRYHFISSIKFMATSTTGSISFPRFPSVRNGLHFVNHNVPNLGLKLGKINGGSKAVRVFPPILHDLQLFRDSEGLDSPGLNGQTCFNGSSFGFSNKSRDFSKKVSVAVDVDEVLGNFVSALNDFIEDRYSSKHSVSEYHVYEFFKIWGCSRNEADVRVHEFFKTAYFKKGIHPLPGTLEALQRMSRQNIIKDHTIEWIEKHYPGIFQEIHFGNHFALDGTSRPKSDICRSLGAQVLIDDNPRYAIECASAGIRVLLFDFEDSYPWSKIDTNDQHPLITKVINWKEVEHQMASRVMS